MTNLILMFRFVKYENYRIVFNFVERKMNNSKNV